MILLDLLAVVALAAPPREAGREAPAPPDARADRYTEGVATVGSWLANRGNVSARPDGSGAARTLVGLAIRDHQSGDRVRFLGDAVFLTDRAGVLSRVASIDYYLGAAGVNDNGGWFQVGRDEARPLDRSGFSFRTWDLRVGKTWKAGGSAGLFAGWFFKNDGRPARPDLSGEACMRYSAFFRVERGALGLRVDADLMTDARRRRYRPVSLDLSVAPFARWGDGELSVAYKPWFTLDRRGAVEAWLLSVGYRFDERESGSGRR